MTAVASIAEAGRGKPPSVRPATLSDLPALLRIEERSFQYDRLSRRSFHHLLTRGHAICLVGEADDDVAGYALVLLHGSTALARLYSFAVDPDHRRLGLGRRLLSAAEAAAREDGRAVMRLEVRADDPQSRALYERAGYQEFGRVEDYYEDGCPAIRMQKDLAGGDVPALARVPFYGQTTDFTCGPAALMMALKALIPEIRLDRSLEIRLWRESTLVYMTSGHGGCDPFGLALAARKHGLEAEVHVTGEGPLFLESVRSEQKREIMRLVQEDFRAAAAEAGIPIAHKGLSVRELIRRMDAGAIPIVLISSFRLYRTKEPHWVVMTGHDDKFVYMHDPYVDSEGHKSETDGINVPVAIGEFERMARYGSARLRAAVIVSRREPR